MDYLSSFCTTDHQLNVLNTYISEGSYAKAGQVLGINKSTVGEIITKIRQRAALAGVAPESGLTHQTATGFTTKRISTMYDADGEITSQWHIQEPDKANFEEMILSIVKGLCSEIPKYEPVEKPEVVSSEFMNDIIIGDPHLDMLAYDKEVGSDWDSEIAYEQHKIAVLNLLNRAPAANTGMLTILGDSLHRDSMKALTPGSGNLVDVDGRLGRSLENAVRLFRSMVNSMLSKHKNVVVNFIRGNHSETLELALRMMLTIAYENEPRVAVLDNTSKHIPFVFGNNFLLTTHGDKLNDQKKADIAVGHFRSQHGAAKFTHVRCGHVHHASLKEVSGCLVETFQALPTPDAWHYESGYVTSDQSVSMLTYHKAGGIVSRLLEYPRIFMNQ